MPKDYYKILGVLKSASNDDIKKAFRKLSHQHHPDKGGDQEKFKEINEAYQVLSDPKKRATYDQFGSADFSGRQNSWAGFDPSSMGGFEFNFGGGLGDIFEDFFGSTVATIQAEVQISVSQAVLGDTLKLRIESESFDLTIPPGTQDGQQFAFKGKGKATRRGRGDLII